MEINVSQYDQVFVLTDENTLAYCWPKISGNAAFTDAKIITIKANDNAKNLETASRIWTELQRNGATRHTVLVCLGGGMVTDMGGFTASTFKRGIDFIHIPTTLLAMVDASIGGKTGLNFGGLKNEIGVFAEPKAIIVHQEFLETLPLEQNLSGYAEMIKHALLHDVKTLSDTLQLDPTDVKQSKYGELIRLSMDIKRKIVEQDPHEKGIRKALNLGHTIGHAIESWSISKGRPMPHGFAVAHGLVGALYLSTIKSAFPTSLFRQTVTFIREHYGRPAITCEQYPTLIELMEHDKKNDSGHINFTLLADVGQPLINQHPTKEEVVEALDFIREG